METIQSLLNDNIQLSNNQHGYILKKLITFLIYNQGFLEHEYYQKIYNQQKEKWIFYLSNYNKFKFKDKTSSWWLDTHGINIHQTNMIKFFNL